MREWFMRGAIVASLGACVQSGEVVCERGVVCPAGFTCSATGCISPDQFEACVGLATGDSCMFLGRAGTCSDGACVVANCGNALIEPGEVCDDGNTINGDGCNGTCTSSEVCGNGVAELTEQCDCGTADAPGEASCDGTFNGGAICTEACILRYCGNGVKDPGEVCDDGNFVAGDGCSAQCRSDETCGNGFSDYSAGEQCDDGNRRGRDGCSSGCVLEPRIWQSLKPGTFTRVDAAIAYDAARGRVVLFGGFAIPSNQSNLGETWEYDGVAWRRMNPIASPPARSSAAMVYDAKQRRTVLFGGLAGSTGAAPQADTWSYDGVTWTQIGSTSTAPPARSSHALAYDAKRGRIVMFGGVRPIASVNTRVNDTWELDGSTWTQVSTGTSPAGRQGHAMAFDAKRGVTVLYGGKGGTPGSPTFLSDVWEYDGANWTTGSLSGSPPGSREAHAMVWDTKNQRIVLHAGTPDDSTYVSDTYSYNGTAWTPLASGPTQRSRHSMAYDTGREVTVVVGGANSGGAVVGTHELDASWSTLPAPSEPVFPGAAMAYDAARGRTVVFGGLDFNNFNVVADTWELHAGTWQLRTGSGFTSIPGRYGHAMAYNATSKHVVVFGGNPFGPNDMFDTWEYDGSAWTSPTPSVHPSGRSGHAMAFDAARNCIVLFGGGNAGTADAQTWEYAGGVWTQIAPTTSPTARRDHTMVYDLARKKIVLFGGHTAANGTVLGDTWEYDGATWSPIVITPSPPGRYSHAMSYDPVLGRSVIYGGVDDYTPRSDVWDYDGNAWHERAVAAFATTPGAHGDTRMAFDAQEQHVVMFTGDGTEHSWLYGFADLSPPETCTSDVDYDADSQPGCTDSECWGSCTPLCPPVLDLASCTATPACGDGACSALETCRNCPADCAVGGAGCPVRCGDFHCDAPENTASCPADCH